jgi:hypothetical protein
MAPETGAIEKFRVAGAIPSVIAQRRPHIPK